MLDVERDLSSTSITSGGQGPLLSYPLGAAIVSILPPTSARSLGSAPIYSVTNGIQDPRAVALLDASITIEQGEQFSVVLTAQLGFSVAATRQPPATA